MEWEDIRYKDYMIWVGEAQEEWIASWHALPKGGVMATAMPGEGEVVSGKSREAAIEAAKQRIDEIEQRRHKP